MPANPKTSALHERKSRNLQKHQKPSQYPPSPRLFSKKKKTFPDGRTMHKHDPPNSLGGP